MKQKDLTDTWPQGTKKIVLRTIPQAFEKVVFKETSTGTNAFIHPISSTYQLVISYYYSQKVFVVWNAAVHAQIHDLRGMTTLSIGADADALIKSGFGKGRIESIFKSVKQKGTKDCVELVTLVGVDALYDFCKAYSEYIIPELNHIPKGKQCLYATPGGEIQRFSSDNKESYKTVEREREIFSRAKRDPSFRQLVIERWGGKCIICGASEERILEAAHRESVKNGGSDDPSNGYCLCANHHRMYDSALLDIDIENSSFECNSESAKAMSWYETEKKRGFKLFLPEILAEEVTNNV